MELTPRQKRLIDAGELIATRSPSSDDLAYLARQLVQATLPHSNPGDVPVWQRTNGRLTLAIQPGFDLAAGRSYGIPYGTLPRLLLFWLTTEAVRTKSRRIELGDSMAVFMRALGLDPSRGGPRSDATRLRDQAERLFRARISFVERRAGEGFESVDQRDMLVADRHVIWWTARQPNQTTLWGNYIELSETFHRAITAQPVPADLRALSALKRSPLALDLYVWLSHESFRARRSEISRFVTWQGLMEQLGASYSDEADLRRKVKAALAKIIPVYPGLRLGPRVGGIEVLPTSRPAVSALS